MQAFSGIAPALATYRCLRVRSTVQRLAGIFLLFILSHAPISAATYDWLPNPGTGDWNTPANWTGTTVPNSSSDTAEFATSSVTNLSLSAPVTVDGVTFDAGGSAFTIATGSNNFFFTGAGVNNNSGITQNFTTNGGGIEFSNSATAGDLTVYTNNGASGYVLFKGTASGGSASLVNNNATASIDISGLTNGGTTAGSIAGNGAFFLGGNTLTVGSLNTDTTFSGVIQDGGQSGGVGGSLTKVGTGILTLSGTNTYTGITTINAGTLSVTGSITNSSDIVLGGGILKISGGATVTTDDTTINSSSEVSVSGNGSTLTNNFGVFVNAGTVNVLAGATMSSRDVVVGQSGGATTTIDGPGSSWSANGHFSVSEGPGDNGAVNVTNGATLSTKSATVGDGGLGVVTVKDSSSSWVINGDLDVGNGAGASGTLSISGAATVSDGNANIGNGDNTTAGSVTVDGAGSSWTNSGDLFVGDGGSGSLQVTNGAQVSSGSGNVGSGSTGSVTIDGTGSKWTITGDLVVSVDAPGSSGSLTISNNGVVSAATTTIGNHGTVTDDVALTSPGGVSIASGGLLKGIGLVTGNTVNDGTVAPGSASLGTLHITGTYQQNTGGALDITIGSLDFYDALAISGSASLDGALEVMLEGYTGHAGDVFTILRSSSLTGNFSTIQLPSLSDGLFFTESTDADNVYLTVNTLEAVPEASTWLAGSLVAGTLLASFFRRIKARRA